MIVLVLDGEKMAQWRRTNSPKEVSLRMSSSNLRRKPSGRSVRMIVFNIAREEEHGVELFN